MAKEKTTTAKATEVKGEKNPESFSKRSNSRRIWSL